MTDPSAIALSYLQGWLLVDVLACFPFNLLGDQLSGLSTLQVLIALPAARVEQPFSNGTALNHPVPQALRLLRLARLLRVFNLVRGGGVDSNWNGLAKAVFYVTLQAELLGCLWYFIGKHAAFPDNGFSPGSAAYIDPEIDPLFELVVKCFFWGMQALTNIGGNLHPVTMPEIWLSLLCVVCGMFTFSYIVGNMYSLIQSLNLSQTEFSNLIGRMRTWFAQRQMPPELAGRVENYLHDMFEMNNGMDEDSMLQRLPCRLRRDILKSMHVGLLTEMKLFKHADDGLLTSICEVLHLEPVFSGDFIIRRGEIGEEMFFVREGLCEVVVGVPETGATVSTISTGGFFGEVALTQRVVRSASVRAATYCELLVLHRSDFEYVMEFYTELRRMLAGVGTERIGRDKLRRAHTKLRAVFAFGGFFKKQAAAAAAGGAGGGGGVAAFPSKLASTSSTMSSASHQSDSPVASPRWVTGPTTPKKADPTRA